MRAAASEPWPRQSGDRLGNASSAGVREPKGVVIRLASATYLPVPLRFMQGARVTVILPAPRQYGTASAAKGAWA